MTTWLENFKLNGLGEFRSFRRSNSHFNPTFIEENTVACRVFCYKRHHHSRKYTTRFWHRIVSLFVQYVLSPSGSKRSNCCSVEKLYLLLELPSSILANLADYYFVLANNHSVTFYWFYFSKIIHAKRRFNCM